MARLGVENPLYHVGLGYAYFILNQFQEAELSFKEALKNAPELTLVHLGLSQVYQKTYRDDLAYTELSEVLKREPDHAWAKEEYEFLRSLKTEGLLKEAKFYSEQGNTEKEKEAYLKALHYSPQFLVAHLALAEIYRKQNELQSALIHLKAASSIEPKNKEVWKDYADTLFQAEKYSRSLEVYELAQELDPKNKVLVERIDSLKTKLGIFELPSQYDTIPSLEAITKEDIAALLGVKFKEILDDSQAKPPIIVDVSTSWASKFILKTTSLGILDVYENHTFQPKKIVTRAEMAEVLFRLINFLKKKGYRFIQQFPPEKIQIADVSPDNYYHQPISQIIAYQIMDLSSDRTFRPEQSLGGTEAIGVFDLLLSLIQ